MPLDAKRKDKPQALPAEQHELSPTNLQAAASQEPQQSNPEHAVRAAAAVAARLGLRPVEPTVLGSYSNTLVLLRPLPVVARVSTVAGSFRNSGDWMRRELQVADALARRNAPSVRPSSKLPPGPHLEGGLWLSFWEYLVVSADHTDPARTGEMLGGLHDALQGVGANLLQLSPFSEAHAIALGPLGDRLAPQAKSLVRKMFQGIRREIERANLRYRPLHGDAHHGNLWQTDRGAIWGDFEDVCAGPAEWDLACLTASSVVFGKGRAAREALAGYGAHYDRDLLDLLIVARTLQAVSWALLAIGDIAQNQRLLARLDWLRARY